MMRSFGVACFLLHTVLGIVLLCEGHLDDILSSYDTLHSRDVVTHHLKKRDVDLDNLYTTERVVSFSSFGRAFRLRLFRQEGLFSDDLFAAEVGENQTAEIYLNEDEFYTGFIDGESRTQKTFAYWEDDKLVATIQTRNDTFFVEPSWRHLPESDNYTMIVYRLSDVKVGASQLTTDRVAFCSPPELNDTLSSSVDGDSFASHWHYASNMTGRRRRVKRSDGGQQQQDQRTVCSVMLVADYRFYNSVGKSSITNTAKYMIGVLSRVNGIYTSTQFGPNFADLGFEIEGVLVHSSSTSGENNYNMERTKWDTSELLNAFSSIREWEKYCLVHLFTSTAFDSGVLGLAWVASDKPGSLGGICSPCSSGKCYNTGWSTSLNKFENKLTTLEAGLVAAHELGHGWGSQHDPDRSECSPSDGGKFIMYPFSVSGREPNNNKFSPCSQKSISSVLQVKKESCFVAPTNSFCGNYKVEEGEQCDAGPSGRAGEDKCCDSQCQLKNGNPCSDSNSDCCQNCTFAPRTKLCWTSSPDSYTYSSCRAESYCPGNSTVCPETALPDRAPCANNGHCMNGICLDVCEYSGLISCVCDSVENSCVWCCKQSANDSCQPMNRIDASYPLLPLADGYPCKQGYCQTGKCKQSVSTTTNRLWDFIQHLTVNRVLLIMRNNLVMVTILLTLVPYVIFCIVICYIDYKKKQKAKTRQAWLDKNNDQLTLDKSSSIVKKIEGIHNRRYGH